MDPRDKAVVIVPRQSAHGGPRGYWSKHPSDRHPPPQPQPEPRYYEDQYRDERSKSSKVPWIILVVVLLLSVIGLAVAYGITVNKEEPPAECNTVSFDSTIRLSDLPYTPALNDKTSSDFAELAQWFCTDMTKGLEKGGTPDECGTTTDRCQVSNYRKGSIIIQYKIWINFLKTKEEIKEMGPILKEEVEETIAVAVADGQTNLDQENIFKKGPSDMSSDLSEVEQVPQCPALYIDENSRIIGGLHRSNYEGESITVRCNPGFKVHGDEIDQVLTCGTNGVWDNEITPCVEIECPAIKQEDLENKIIRELGTSTNNVFNSVILTDCEKGYSLNTEDPTDTTAAIKCMSNGEWDSVLPPCLALTCPDLQALPRNTSMEGSGKMTNNMYNDEITLTCNEGMQFESEETSKTWTCDHLGQWNDDFEGCEYINGIWSEWTTFPECTSKCSDETVNRTRECINPPDSESKYPLPCIGEMDIDYEDCEPDDQCVSVYQAFTGETSDTVITFDSEKVDKTGAFDGTVFTAPVGDNEPDTSIYLFSLSGGTVGSNAMELFLVNKAGDGVGGIQSKVHTEADIRGTNIDTVSRDVLIKLKGGEEVEVQVNGETNGQGSQDLTSVSIFSYTGLMKPDGVAFTVAFEADELIDYATQQDLFQGLTPLINLNDGFDPSDGSFIAPKPGYYFFSTSLTSEGDTRVDFRCEGSCFQDVAVMYEDDPYFTISRSGMFYMNRLDKMTAEIAVSTTTSMMRRRKRQAAGGGGGGGGSDIDFFGSDNIETSFSGFLYEPCAVEPVAFFALNDQSFHSSIMDVNPMYFNWVITNIGESFDHSILTARVAGYYYFHFTRPVLNEDDGDNPVPAQVWLMQNDAQIAGLFVDQSDDESVMSRSIIVKLQKYDQVYIKEMNTDMKDYYPGAARAFLGMILQ